MLGFRFHSFNLKPCDSLFQGPGLKRKTCSPGRNRLLHAEELFSLHKQLVQEPYVRQRGNSCVQTIHSECTHRLSPAQEVLHQEKQKLGRLTLNIKDTGTHSSNTAHDFSDHFCHYPQFFATWLHPGKGIVGITEDSPTSNHWRSYSALPHQAPQVYRCINESKNSPPLDKTNQARINSESVKPKVKKPNLATHSALCIFCSRSPRMAASTELARKSLPHKGSKCSHILPAQREVCCDMRYSAPWSMTKLFPTLGNRAQYLEKQGVMSEGERTEDSTDAVT